MNAREQIARTQNAAYVAAKWPRYALTPEGEALLAEHAARLAALPREIRACDVCGDDLGRGQTRFCSLGCFRRAQCR
jgi:hypothetical protein